MHRYTEVTVHGRFQPPLHVNHWNYIKHGFDIADHVTILITNPFHDESYEETASWRSDPENNPFTYDHRVQLFEKFFKEKSIPSDRFDFRPFNIQDPVAFAELDPSTPNIVNVYSDWSAKKVELFKEHNLEVIQLNQEKSQPVSGTLIRQIIKEHGNDPMILEMKLLKAGFMPEAIPGLLDFLSN